jgi:hypothetical protein
MTMLSALEDDTKVEVSFNDVIRGKPRTGVVSFVPPCYYHFRTSSTDEVTGTTSWTINLLVLAVPISPGRCRVFTCLAPGKKFPLPVPKWIFHSMTNRFLESVEKGMALGWTCTSCRRKVIRVLCSGGAGGSGTWQLHASLGHKCRRDRAPAQA